MNVTVSHVDTCFSCYLNDHHNRDGELLLGVYVYGGTRVGEVKAALLEEIAAADWGLPDDFDYRAFDRAVGECFAGSNGRTLFDADLDHDYDGDMPQAWFLVAF